MSQKIATTLHTLLCKADHQKECLWYLEAQQAECWELPHHQKWVNKAEGVLLLSEHSEEEVEILILELIKIINQLKILLYKYHGLEDFINVMLKETCLKK